MQRRLSVLLALLLSTLGVGSADPGDVDGADLPVHAAWLAPGTYEGTLGALDDADWFLVALPAGHGLLATATLPDTSDDLHLSLATPEGDMLADEHLTPGHCCPGGAMVEGQVLAGWQGAIAVGVNALFGEPVQPTAYTLRLEVVPLPDLVVTAIHVEEKKGHIERTVDVTLANVGARPTSGTLTLLATTSTDGATTLVGRATLALAVDETRTVRFAWDARGLVGDVQVSAIASGESPDADPQDNVGRVAHHVFVSGFGLTLHAPGVCVGAYAGACVGASATDGYAWAGAYSLATFSTLRARHTRDEGARIEACHFGAPDGRCVHLGPLP